MILSYRNKFNPILLDPVAAPRFAARALARRSAPERFKIGRFLDHREVTRKACSAGFHCRDFRGIGTGPLRLAGRSLFSENASIRLSALLTGSLRALGCRGLIRWLADVSVWVYQSGPRAQAGWTIAPHTFERGQS